MRKSTTTEQDKEICKMYTNGKTQKYIANIYGVHRITVLNILKRNNIKTRKTAEWARKYSIDENMFEKIDCEWKAYFVGYMYADGNIYKEQRGKTYTKYEASINLSQKDKNILEQFNTLIYPDGKRPLEYRKGRYHINKKGKATYTKPSYRLRIINKKICLDLIKLGVIPAKSLILDFPTFKQISKKYFHHFVRGFFDGDGTISLSQYKKKKHWNNGYWRKLFHVVSSKKFITKMSVFFRDHLNIKSSTKLHRNRKNKILTFTKTEYIIKIYNYMYEDATIFLPRKKEIFDKIIQIYLDIDGQIKNLRLKKHKNQNN